VDLDEPQKIGKDNLLRPLKPFLAIVEDLYTGDISWNVWISGLIFVSAREQILFRQIPLVLPDIHVVKLGSVAGLLLDLLPTFLLAQILFPWKEPKIVLKLHSSTLYRLSKASIISQCT
jgi:hypothetical protein